MKLEKMSIKYKLFFYLALFAAVMLVMLWFFQIVFLDDFYRQIKINNIKSSAETIEKNIDNEELNVLLDSLSRQNQTYIRVMLEDGTNVFSSDAAPDSLIHRMPGSELYDLYKKAEQNGGELLESRGTGEPRDPFLKEKYFQGPMSKGMGRIDESVIYVRTVQKADGSKVVLMLNSTITPVNATVDTLRVQLVYVTIITILLALGLALFVSKRISRPIIKINHSAKELAKGNYETTFEGRGYLEIAELNDTLNYAAKELSKVEGLRRELIANISHDLRTPLTMITGYGEVMRDLPGENTPENIQIIIDEARRLTTLVNDIMDISKFRSGTQSLTTERFNLTKSVEEILLRYNKLTEQDGYKLKFSSSGDAWVKADPVKISQVLYNLINNAITYTGPDKTVTIVQSNKGEHVKIEIIDSGEGIEEELLPLIWDRYYKADKAHKRAAIGTGLGLSIVKTILDMHRAEYGVISKNGQGSIFWFELKLDKEES
ncbi:sensor histidine kinase [Ruminiclostridium cellobioparum]|uniref:histidine kinase n=1 Tax=Ruminiclostridium cellobioparum subsp. termitidis CT1112 TaxID=1195236 RepID=S0FU91_RUMCE|nr:HAMP domain-containing sensor histidine kinase [Ruminiclostridium cellobioparum]EMS72083.1 Signal transduction histidine kinase [Ruminiclostridium cellobioparum subsp. termitidis CT1112]